MLFQNARLVFPDRLAPRGSLRATAGRIAAVSGEPLPPEPGEEVIDLAGRGFLSPGFIDLHIHGAMRRDAMEATPEAFRAICDYHATGGTTSLALTTVTETHERILATLHAVKAYREQPPTGARVLGVHIEGPYFSPEKPGAHPVHLIRHPSVAEYHEWLALDVATQMTVAPELPGALPLMAELRKRGLIASGGHSNAWDHEAAEGFAHGMRQVTHTFNCMSSTRRRGPFREGGLLEFALSEPEILCEVIADGKHVSPTLLRMLYQAKGPAGIVLVTDAAAGAGLAEGETFHLGSMEGIVEDEVALLVDRSALCSSTATMIRLVRNMVEICEAPLHEAIRMATYNAALALGQEKEIGVLEPGARADVVILSDALEVKATYVGGERVHAM